MSVLLPKTRWLIRINNGLNAEGKPKYLNPLSWLYGNLCKPIFHLTPQDRLFNLCALFYWDDVVFGLGCRIRRGFI
jgi:hypothetical protein